MSPLADLETRIQQRLSGTIMGMRGLIRALVIAVISRGHVLVEGPPGLGKTLLGKSLAAALSGRFTRIQGTADLMPADAAGQEKRRREVHQMLLERSLGVAKKYRPQLVEWYGKERGEKVQHAEAFEICEYGSQPTRADLRRLFPFFPE